MGTGRQSVGARVATVSAFLTAGFCAFPISDFGLTSQESRVKSPVVAAPLSTSICNRQSQITNRNWPQGVNHKSSIGNRLTGSEASAYTRFGMRLRRFPESGVALLMIGAFSVATFSAVSCGVRCAFSVRARQAHPATADCCHPGKHQSSGANPSGGHATCSLHGVLTISSVPVSSLAVTLTLATVGRHAFPLSLSLALLQPLPFYSKVSHSPPGLITGRTICQKEALLRI
jgi:hypothetical protein